MYIYTHNIIHMYIYIYIYTEREREAGWKTTAVTFVLQVSTRVRDVVADEWGQH